MPVILILFDSSLFHKGSTINDLGEPEEESKIGLFFPRKCLLRIIFSERKASEIFF